MPGWYLQHRLDAELANFDILVDYQSLTVVLTRAMTADSRKIYTGRLRVLLAVANEGDPLGPGQRAARILFGPQGSIRLLAFFNRMADSDMNPSTRQNYHQTLRCVGNAVRGRDPLITCPPDLARAAESLLERHLAQYIRRCDNDRARVIGEQRAEAEFVEREISVDLGQHEAFWQQNLEELRRLQVSAEQGSQSWRKLYYLRIVVFLFYVPVRRSFWSSMHNAGVHLDATRRHYLALPRLEKSNHLKKGPRNYFQIPQDHSDVLDWYIEHGRTLLGGARDGPDALFVLNDRGQPVTKDNMTDIVRKFLYECTGQKLNLRTYRFLFAMAVMTSEEMSEAHKIFLTQQLRHSKSTHEKYYKEWMNGLQNPSGDKVLPRPNLQPATAPPVFSPKSRPAPPVFSPKSRAAPVIHPTNPAGPAPPTSTG